MLEQACPILPSRDFTATKSFYESWGFQSWYDDGNYLLINRDKVFAMVLNLGTPHNLAAFRIMDSKGIPNLYPLTMFYHFYKTKCQYGRG